MLPPFDERGNLSPGVYETNSTEFCDHFGFNAHRQNILVGLQIAPQLLAQANCQRVYIGGSFVYFKAFYRRIEMVIPEGLSLYILEIYLNKRKITSIQELPIALIRARIALGMTQKELAEKMGVKEQQV
jgi:hypothetical protein